MTGANEEEARRRARGKNAADSVSMRQSARARSRRRSRRWSRRSSISILTARRERRPPRAAVAAPNYCGGCAREAGAGFKVSGAPPHRPFVSGRVEGNPELSFSFSRFCLLIRNNGGKTNAAGTSASPPYDGGRSAAVDGGGACECASRAAAIHGADAQGRVDQWKPGG